MENHQKTWTEQDFDSLSWHDNEVHGIRWCSPSEEFRFDVVLEIEHILKWVKQPDGSFTFVIAPALLIFHQVTRLQCSFMLGYKEHLVIDRIDRETPPAPPEASVRPPGHRWIIRLRSETNAAGIILLDASGFTQQLVGEPVETTNQSLDDDQR